MKTVKMAIYFVGDIHFGHKNMLKYEPNFRGYNTVEDMNNSFIKLWNSKISNQDIVYNLGDFIFTISPNKAEQILKRLNYKKMVLIIGNHDNKDMLRLYKKYGIECKYADMLNKDGYHFYLSHYPTLIEARKTYNIHGHIHSKSMGTSYHINVGCDYLNKIAISFDDLIKEYVK